MTNTALAPITNISDILSTIENQLSPATRHAYQQELRTLHAHYSLNGWTLYPVNDDGHIDPSRYLTQVLSYLQHRSDAGVTVSTINKALSAIKWDAASTNPHAVGLLAMKQVSAFMSGLNRTRRAETVKKANALTTEQLTTLYTHLRNNRTVRNVRDKALISFGIATALRASNIAELQLRDLTPTLTYNGYLVNVRWSKTDQTGNGYTVPVKASTNTLLDPINAVREWLTVLASYGITKETNPDFPLFPTLRGNNIKEGEIQHPAVTITKLVRDHLLNAEVVTADTVNLYSSHTLRSTFITLSAQAGVDEKSIATISGHKSMTVLRSYDRTATEAFAQTDYLN